MIFTNSNRIRDEVYFSCVQILRAVKKSRALKNSDSLDLALKNFGSKLRQKRFSMPSDSVMVIEMMEGLIERFAKDWNKEREKQRTMLKRARQMLLNWGSFSDNYIARAGFLAESWTLSASEWIADVVRVLTTTFVPFSLPLALLSISLADPPTACKSTVVDCAQYAVVMAFVVLLQALPPVICNREFAGIPTGLHTARLCLVTIFQVHSFLSSGFDACVRRTPHPVALV